MQLAAIRHFFLSVYGDFLIDVRRRQSFLTKAECVCKLIWVLVFFCNRAAQLT